MGGLGIPITDAGDHTIRLVYHTAGLKMGIIISIIGLIIFIGYVLLKTLLKNKPNTDDSKEDNEDENESPKDVVKNDYYEFVD
jgi:FtsH-binding integral membrane protein